MTEGRHSVSVSGTRREIPAAINDNIVYYAGFYTWGGEGWGWP